MGDPHAGRRLIAPALWALGIARIDSIILSHPDADHFNAVPDVLERFPVGEILVTQGFATAANPAAVALMAAIRSRGVPVRTIAAGARWRLGRDVELEVLHPPNELTAGVKDNARSIVVAVESAGRRLLLTGDLEGQGLAMLAASPPPAVDVLLSPHHGSRTANPPWLLAWAKPRAIVVSQRRPIAGTRDALEGLAAPVFRTWNRGAVRLRWSERGIDVHGFLDAPTLRAP
jgi:competence protein ComEC